MEKLNLTKCKNNEEVVELIKKRVNSVSYDTLQREVNKHFIFQQKATKAVYTGLSMGMNVFLSGPGGYGKSTLVKFILNYFGIPGHTVVGYKDMPVDALLGIPNMQKLIQDSEYELDFSKCIFGKRGVVIGEEFTDILPSTAAALKDVLTEKGLRIGQFKQESFIASMIICANKSSFDIVDDSSKKALYDERFPIKVDVKWAKHSKNDYYKLLLLKFPEGDKKALFFMAKLFEANTLVHNNIITPRKALDITKVFLEKGDSFIEHFEINLDSVDLIKSEAYYEYNRKSTEEQINELITSIKAMNKNDVSYPLSIYYSLYRLSALKLEEEQVAIVNNAKTELENLADVIPNSKTKSLDNIKLKFNALNKASS